MDNTISEHEVRKFNGYAERMNAQSTVAACQLLYAAGATEDEVDVILGYRPIPSNPDEDWARGELTWYTNHFDDPNGR